MNQLRIRNRIALTMLLSAVLMLPVALLALYYVSQMNGLVTILTESDAELLRVGNTAIHHFLEVRNLERTFLLSNDTSYLTTAQVILDHIRFIVERGRRIDLTLTTEFDSLVINLLSYRQLLDSLASIPALRSSFNPNPKLTELRTRRNRVLGEAAITEEPTRAESLLNVIKRLNDEIEMNELLGGARAFFHGRIEQTADEIIRRSEKIIARANQRSAEHKARVNRLYLWSQRNIITAIFIFTALLIYFLITLPNSIVGPIKRLANALSRAEQGDLNIRVTIDTGDELTELARQLNRVFARLREFDEAKANQILSLDRRFRMLAKNIQEGVLIVDRAQKIIYANPAAETLLEIPPAEATNRSLRDFPQLVDFIPHLEQLLSGAASRQECEILPHLPGSAVCFEALRDRSGIITAALIVVTNPAANQPG